MPPPGKGEGVKSHRRGHLPNLSHRVTEPSVTILDSTSAAPAEPDMQPEQSPEACRVRDCRHPAEILVTTTWWYGTTQPRGWCAGHAGYAIAGQHRDGATVTVVPASPQTSISPAVAVTAVF